MLNARLIGRAGRFLFWMTISCGQGMSDISGYGASCRGFTWTTWSYHDIRWESHGSYMGGRWELPWTYRGAGWEQTLKEPAQSMQKKDRK